MTNNKPAADDVNQETGVSAVVPVYGGGDLLRPLVERLCVVLSTLGRPWEIILVDDASAAPTSRIARELSLGTPNVALLRLARNSGQHAALLAGIRAAMHGIVVTLDDDLQNPPEEVPRLIERLEEGDLDVVHGYSPMPAHSLWRRVASRTLRRIIASTTDGEWLSQGGSLRAFKTNLRDAFVGAAGPGVSLSVLLSWATNRIGHIEVRHDARVSGQSGYSLRKLARFSFDTLTGHSTVLLNFVTVLGFAAVALGLGILGWVLGAYFVLGSSVAGFPFLASSIALFSGVQMLSLGIIGQYLGRIHVRVQGRPMYHIAERVSSCSESCNQPTQEREG